MNLFECSGFVEKASGEITAREIIKVRVACCDLLSSYDLQRCEQARLEGEAR